MVFDGSFFPETVPQTISAVGAFLTGVAAFIAAFKSISLVRRRERDLCERRITQIQASYREGFKTGIAVERRSKEGGESDAGKTREA